MCFHEYTAILDLRKMAQTITITFASKRPSSWQNRWHVSSCIARRFSPTNVSSKTTVVRWCTPTSHHCPILGLGSDTSLFFGVVVVWILSGQSPQRPGSAPKHMAHQCSDLVLMKFVYFRRTTPSLAQLLTQNFLLNGICHWSVWDFVHHHTLWESGNGHSPNKTSEMEVIQYLGIRPRPGGHWYEATICCLTSVFFVFISFICFILVLLFVIMCYYCIYYIIIIFILCYLVQIFVVFWHCVMHCQLCIWISIVWVSPQSPHNLCHSIAIAMSSLFRPTSAPFPSKPLFWSSASDTMDVALFPEELWTLCLRLPPMEMRDACLGKLQAHWWLTPKNGTS